MDPKFVSKSYFRWDKRKKQLPQIEKIISILVLHIKNNKRLKDALNVSLEKYSS